MTIPATLAAVVAALREPRRRARWLRHADPALARAFDAARRGPNARAIVVKPDGSAARTRYPWDGATVQIHVYRKTDGRCSVVATTMGLDDANAVGTRRTQWRAALAALSASLSEPPAPRP
jgi:hypothetical protein